MRNRFDSSKCEQLSFLRDPASQAALQPSPGCASAGRERKPARPARRAGDRPQRARIPAAPHSEREADPHRLRTRREARVRRQGGLIGLTWRCNVARSYSNEPGNFDSTARCRAIARTTATGENAEKKEGTSARRALRFAAQLSSSVDQTATTLCLALPWTDHAHCANECRSLGTGAANSVLATRLSCVDCDLHREGWCATSLSHVYVPGSARRSPSGLSRHPFATAGG
jgi:hypothetical protein